MIGDESSSHTRSQIQSSLLYRYGCEVCNNLPRHCQVSQMLPTEAVSSRMASHWCEVVP